MENYDHYVAVDWSKNNMAIARLTRHSKAAEVRDVASDIEYLKVYLSQLRGTVILTFEESTPAQWLYTELRDTVIEIVVCDPRRNKLLSEGPKTDKIDAIKLVNLLRAGLLKPVYHSGHEYIKLRKLVRGYMAVTKNGVRLKNQRAALLLSSGKDNKAVELKEDHEQFALKEFDFLIENNDASRDAYAKRFGQLKRQNKVIRNLTTIPGIDVKGAVKLVSLVVDPCRFNDKSRWISYCGLIKHEKISGGRSYGRRSPKYSRMAKSIFKTAALACCKTGADNVFTRYYEYLMKEKNYPDFNARHTVARRIAVITLGVLKTGRPFEDKWSDKKTCETKKDEL